jgi:hypothetical protein
MPAGKKTRRKKRTKREALVHSHMERVSRDLLEKHPDVVRNFIGRNFGIYALYKKTVCTTSGWLPVLLGA